MARSGTGSSGAGHEPAASEISNHESAKGLANSQGPFLMTVGTSNLVLPVFRKSLFGR